MIVGEKYTHPQLGVGVVTKRAIVQGKTGFWVSFGYIDEFIAADFDQPKPVDKRTAETSYTGTLKAQSTTECSIQNTSLPPETVAARKGVVALRLGQILESHVHQLSVSTEAAEASLRDALRQAAQRPTMVMVEGVWGGGKTHLLTLLSALAREEQFVTASVVMDGTGVTLSDPMLLMGSITSAIRFPDENMPSGLGSHLLRADPAKLRVRGATLLSDALDKVPKEALQDAEVLHVLEDYFGLSLTTSNAKARLSRLGWRVQLPALKARTVADRAARFCDLIRNWAQFSVTVGARGLVLILDEIDVEFAATAWWDRTSQTKAERRKWLIEELGNMREHDVPILVAFASAPASADVSEENDAVKGIDSAIGGLDYHIKVPTPSASDMWELGNRVLDLYGQAYPGSAELVVDGQRKELLDNMVGEYQRKMSPVPRAFVRRVLEYMDVKSTMATDERK